jgi:polyisoprenoid-binding protein YceI
MKKMIAILLLTGLASFSAHSMAADSYSIDPRHTFPSFEISHLGFSIQRGRFNHTTGKVVLDPKAANGGSIEIAIDAASISTGLPELEQHLRSKDFFDAAQFPQIKFVSSKLSFNKEQLQSVDGNLTLHGVTKPVHLMLDHFHCGLNPIVLKNVCGANAVAMIKRAEFGVSKYVPVIADDVKIIIQVEVTKD